MSFNFNGVNIPDIGGKIHMNGESKDNVYMNGVLVWSRYVGQPSPLIVTSTKTLVAGVDFPANVPLNVCLVGGGGAGTKNDANWYDVAGGQAGGVASNTFILAHGVSIDATIGAGATATGGINVIHNGYPTSFGSLLSGGGGAGGSYWGNLGSKTTCGGTGTDGAMWTGCCGGHSYGGQSSGFGNGGGGGISSTGFPGGIGSGGGACATAFSGYLSGPGGRGQINISW